MILNITDENWAEVIEDTLTVETFTALKNIFTHWNLRKEVFLIL